MTLKNITNVNDMSISEKLENNLISMFDWGFVDLGGYINVDLNQSGCYVDNRSSLIRVTDPRITTGSVWQGPENWVYETGTYLGTPNEATIYINDVIDSGNTATLNYRDGRVTLSTVPTSVKASFAYKYVTFTSARKSRNIRRFQYEAQRFDKNTGNYSIPPEIKLPLPAVTIDVPPISKSKFYGMGQASPRIFNHDINIAIFSETASDAVSIADKIALQEGYTFRTYDPELVQAANDFPLNLNGTLNSGKSYKELCNLYPWASIEIQVAECTYGDYISQNLYRANVRMTTQVVLCGYG